MSRFASVEGAAAGAQNLGRPGFSFLLIFLVVVLFTVSGGVLWPLGINYEGVTGSAASKIHPFTYLAVLVFGWHAFGSRLILDYCIRTI